MTVPDPAAAALRARGRPRDPEIDARVLVAAVDELAQRGIGGFSINSVAARAGVDKRGIYARWPDRDQLVIDALGTLAAGLIPPCTGSLRGDLLALAPAVAAVFTQPRLQVLQRCMAEARDYPVIYAGFRRDSVDRCMAVIEDAIRSGRTRGETAADTNPARAADAFMGLMLTRAALHDVSAPLEEADQQDIVSFCLQAVGWPGSAGP